MAAKSFCSRDDSFFIHSGQLWVGRQAVCRAHLDAPRLLVEKNLTDRHLADRHLADRHLADRHLTDTNFGRHVRNTVVQLAGWKSIDRQANFKTVRVDQMFVGQMVFGWMTRSPTLNPSQCTRLGNIFLKLGFQNWPKETFGRPAKLGCFTQAKIYYILV